MVQVCLDESDPDKAGLRPVGRICGIGYIFGSFVHVSSDPNFDQSDISRRKSEITQTRSAANVLHVAHPRPFSGSIQPREAPLSDN